MLLRLDARIISPCGMAVRLLVRLMHWKIISQIHIQRKGSRSSLRLGQKQYLCFFGKRDQIQENVSALHSNKNVTFVYFVTKPGLLRFLGSKRKITLLLQPASLNSCLIAETVTPKENKKMFKKRSEASWALAWAECRRPLTLWWHRRNWKA